MRSNIANILRRLVVPYGAAADTPRIVLGSDVPQELTDYYAPEGAAVIAAQLWYYRDALWRYDAITDREFSARGVYESGVGVLEIDRYSKTFYGRGPKWEIGRKSGAEMVFGNPDAVPQGGALLDFVGGSQLLVKDGSSLSIAADSNFVMDGYANFRGDADFAHGRLLAVLESAEATGSISPITTVPADVPGAFVDVTTRKFGAVWKAEWVMDAELTVAGAVTAVTRCLVDGVDTGRQAIANFANVTIGARGTFSQRANGVFAAPGTYRIKLQGYRATGTGTVRIAAPHTTVSAEVFE